MDQRTVSVAIAANLFGPVYSLQMRYNGWREIPMLDQIFELSRCCPEAQADGVPCPTLGRSCEVCERARRDELREVPPPPIRPVGCD
jgi:hypothetical protein